MANRTGGDRRSFTIRGTEIPAAPLAPGLYAVATPIGHLGDLSVRAAETLAGADTIICEDRRVTRKLLAHYGIRRPLVTYNDHSTARDRARILSALAAGGSAALASDAGTPLISDPGYRLVGDAIAAGIPVVPVPGPSAVLAALTGAGLPTDRFLFAGFLPPRPAARRKAIAGLAGIDATLVLFEAPQRLAAALADLAAGFGADRPAALCREMTKRHETFDRDSLGGLAARYREDGADAASLRGEMVLVIGPPDPAAGQADDATVDRQLLQALATMSARDAVDAVSAATGRPRRAVYARAIALQAKGGPAEAEG